MRFKSERFDSGQFFRVSFFNVDTVFFILNYGMTQISKKIKVDVPTSFNLIVYVVEQRLKINVLIHETKHSFMQIDFHFKTISPFIILYLLYVFDDLTVFYNQSSCVIAPNAVALWT